MNANSLSFLEINNNAAQCYYDSENRLMQSFHIDAKDNRIWYSFDTLERNKQIIKIVSNNKVIKEMVFSGKDAIGHLDGFFVDEKKIVWATDKYIKPSVILLKNSMIIKRINYPFKVFGNQVLTLNYRDPRDFILWGSDDNKTKSIFLGEFDKDGNFISSLYKTFITLPKNLTFQGFAYDGKYVYVLTGKANSDVKIYKWNVSTGDIINVYSVNYDADITEFGYVEPEGLELTRVDGREYISIGYVSKRVIKGKKIFANCIVNINTNSL